MTTASTLDIGAIRNDYDCIVIGSGLGGSSLAYRLAQLKRRVLVVERGGFLKSRRLGPDDPVGAYIYHVVGSPNDALSFVGGATKFYGAALYRLRESDFGEVRHEAGMSPAWPISYSNLEPYYCQAEAIYRVHGGSYNDPTAPPRSQPFPFPPIPHEPAVARVVQRLAASGSHVSPIPRGIDYGPKGTCVLCGTCDGYFCQIDAKMDAEVAALRPALATGLVDLVTDTECLKVLVDETGTHATGALLRQAGTQKTITAGSVAVCAGVPGSALLLRRSRVRSHPEGLGNANGLLGRQLGGHSAGLIFPLISVKSLGQRHTKTFALQSYLEPAADWPYPTGTIQVAGQMPIWEGAPLWKRSIVHFVANRSLTCFFMTEALPTRESGFEFDGDEIVRRHQPLHNAKTFERLRRLAIKAFRRAGYPVISAGGNYLWHEVGTARFGSDPSTSVADPNCQVHGIKGLYVVDASVLPSAGVLNTGLTIAALALRAGDFIAGERMKQDSELSNHAVRM